jgi:cell shape-determining protein MreC
MLLKVSLIIAILASIVTLVLSHAKVASSIEALKGDLETTRGSLAKATEDAATSKKNEKAAKEQAEKTGKELEETKANLETATSKAREQEARADARDAELNTVKGKFNDAQRELSAWGALGIAVQQVQNRLVELDKANKANDALNAEHVVLVRNIDTLKKTLAKYELDKDVDPAMPPGLKGKVLEVNPQWDFVVLDIGSNQGAVERGVLLVNREGKLVTKVRITTVEPARCIANVMPEWKQADVLAGDTVLY